jgi:hypothetical protein
MDMTECQKLADRFKEKAAAGLVDVKFYVAGEAASEQVCREINRLYEAYENGDCVDLDFDDSHKA